MKRLNRTGMRRTRDDEAFEHFAALAAPRLLRSAWLLTGDWHLAEDLVQETLTRTFRVWPRAGSIEQPQAYAHTVLVRYFLSHRRKRSNSEVPTDVVTDHPSSDGDEVESRLMLAAALGVLSASDRAVVVLRYVLDQSVEDVAAAVGRSPAAIRTQSSRALSKVRAAMNSVEGVNP